MNQPKRPLDLTLGVSVKNLNTSLKVNDLNKLLQQTVQAPDLPTNVSMKLDGNGCALVQVLVV